ncbi:MAG: hypothetical protein IJB86_03590 [Clostridia bacterium]|nr:hypothetical protein [Clostridia bacterium]
MIIEDGTVNIDQLGAKGDAVLPASYNDTIGSVDSCNERTKKTLNINNGSTEYLDENEVAITATDNADYFNKAISNEQVHCICLTAGKIYGTRSLIKMKSDKVLDGNNATIMYVAEANLDPNDKSKKLHMIDCNEKDVGKTYTQNIEIKNVRLIHNSVFKSGDIYIAIFVRHCENVKIHDVIIERSTVGIKTTAYDKGILYNTVKINNVHISDVLTGLEIGDIMNSSVTDSYVSCDYNLLLDDDDANGQHCIYAGGAMKDCVFSNLTLLNAGKGSAINRNEALTSFEYFGENLLFSNIIIDNCDCAVHVGKRTRNSVFKNIIATNVMESGIALCGAEDVLITNCSFRGTDEAACGILIPSDSKELDYIKDVVIDNCSFDFSRKVFFVGMNRSKINDCLVIRNCYFVHHAIDLDYKKAPAYIRGIMSKVTFEKCIFETDSYKTDADSKKGVIFYFDSKKETLMEWVFDRCVFINNGVVSANSPILSDTENDAKNKIFCQMRGCQLKGYRWTIRIATSQTNNLENHSPAIDPCFYENEEENAMTRSDAAERLTQLKRFLSFKNIYVDGAGFRAAEEYGL